MPCADGAAAGRLCKRVKSDVEGRSLRRVQTVLEQGGQFAGINRKVQLKALRWAPPPEGAPPDAKPRCVEALLILKHGGVLTHAGRAQVLPWKVCCDPRPDGRLRPGGRRATIRKATRPVPRPRARPVR